MTIEVFCWARLAAIAFPIPALAPVIMATFPSSEVKLHLLALGILLRTIGDFGKFNYR
jgi:hypothetical protein